MSALQQPSLTPTTVHPEFHFWKRVDKNGPIPEHRPDLGNCWIWTGQKYQKGYGHFHYRRDGKQVHVGAHCFSVPDVPSGMQRDHLCLNKGCVRPSHIEVVTPSENMRRAYANKPRVTHCPRGHEYTPENTFWKLGKWKVCITCRRALQKACPSYRWKKVEG